MRDILVACPGEWSRRALLVKHLGSRLLLRRRIVALHHCLCSQYLLRTKIVVELAMVRTTYHGRVISSITLVLHHIHQLLLSQTIVDLVAWLLRVVQDLGRLAKLLWCFALGARWVRLLAARILLAGIQLSQVLHLDRIFTWPTSGMIHLLRTSPIVHYLVCGRHGATNLIECFDATIFLQSLGNRLVFGELIHDHLLVSLLGGKHIWISFGCHFNKLLVISLHLSHMLVGKLMWCNSSPVWTDANLCSSLTNITVGLLVPTHVVCTRSASWHIFDV